MLDGSTTSKTDGDKERAERAQAVQKIQSWLQSEGDEWLWGLEKIWGLASDDASREDRERLRRLIPDFIQSSIRAASSSTPVEVLGKALDGLKGLADFMPYLLDPHLDTLISICSKTIHETQDSEEHWNHWTATEVLIIVCRRAASGCPTDKYKQIVSSYLHAMLSLMEDEEQWLAVSPDSNRSPNWDIGHGLVSLASLRRALNVNLFDIHLMECIKSFLAEGIWQRRVIALEALTVLGKESSTTDFAVHSLYDPSPRVRYSACSLLSSVVKRTSQITLKDGQILIAILPLLQDRVDLVAAAAAAVASCVVSKYQQELLNAVVRGSALDPKVWNVCFHWLDRLPSDHAHFPALLNASYGMCQALHLPPDMTKCLLNHCFKTLNSDSPECGLAVSAKYAAADIVIRCAINCAAVVSPLARKMIDGVMETLYEADFYRAMDLTEKAAAALPLLLACARGFNGRREAWSGVWVGLRMLLQENGRIEERKRKSFLLRTITECLGVLETEVVSVREFGEIGEAMLASLTDEFWARNETEVDFEATPTIIVLSANVDLILQLFKMLGAPACSLVAPLMHVVFNLVGCCTANRWAIRLFTALVQIVPDFSLCYVNEITGLLVRSLDDDSPRTRQAAAAAFAAMANSWHPQWKYVAASALDSLTLAASREDATTTDECKKATEAALSTIEYIKMIKK